MAEKGAKLPRDGGNSYRT